MMCVCEADFINFDFIFSSRRQHTSSLRDWSSDVCSSDLLVPASMACVLLGAGTKGKRAALKHSRIMMHQPSGAIGRSEERRVGKECRVRRRGGDQIRKGNGEVQGMLGGADARVWCRLDGL